VGRERFDPGRTRPGTTTGGRDGGGVAAGKSSAQARPHPSSLRVLLDVRRSGVVVIVLGSDLDQTRRHARVAVRVCSIPHTL